MIIKSLFYNDFLNWSYVCDILLEPLFWFVENFTACLGPFTGVRCIGKPLDCKHGLHRILHRSTLLVGEEPGDDNNSVNNRQLVTS